MDEAATGSPRTSSRGAPIRPPSPPPSEHRPLVLGRGRFLDDIDLPGTLHLALVRSPHAAARIEGIEAARALAVPGVASVVSGEDIAPFVRPIRTELAPGEGCTYRATEWPALAVGEVRYVGEAVAAVLAASRYAAEDGAALVEVGYAPTRAAANAQAAMAADAPRVHAGLPDNLLFTVAIGAPLAMGGDCVSVRGRFRHPRVTGAAMENRGVLAHFRPEQGELVVWSGTQIPHLLRDLIARSLALDGIAVRVIAPDVGGGFGIKMQAFPEELIAAHLAMRVGRPVQWVEDRIENLLASVHARDAMVEAELYARPDGALLGLAARAVVDVGAYSSFPLSAALEPLTIGSALPGPYRVPAYRYEGVAVATHRCPTGAYRGVGFTLGPLVMEGLMDRLARRTGMDPISLRHRNLIGPEAMPAASAAGVTYDSGDYPALLDLAASKAGYEKWREEQARARSEGRALGIGISCFVEATGMNRAVYRRRGMVHVPGYDAARLRLGRDGTIEAAVSTPSQGQALKHAYARILARRLGVSEGRFAWCSGTRRGRRTARARLRAGRWWAAEARCWAPRFGWSGFWCSAPRRRGICRRNRFVIGRAEFERIGDASARMELAELAALGEDAIADCTYDPPKVPYSSAAHLALVEVDRETGAVKVLRYVVAEDCGAMVDPQAVEGQVRGGVAQGIGSALLEEMVYDAEGQLLSASLADYLLPGATDIPRIEIVHRESAEADVKGVGESGTIGAPAAIAGAVLDALECDPEEIVLPLAPERVRGLAVRGR